MVKISHSMRSQFKACPRKVYFKYVAGIERILDDSPARAIGRAFHSALESVRKGEGWQYAVAHSKENLIDSLNIHSLPQNDIAQEAIKMEIYVTGYLEKFMDENRHWYGVEKNIETESEIGFIDAMFMEGDDYYVVEDKTRSVLTKNISYHTKMNEQIVNYACLLRDIGFTVKGSFYRETMKSRSSIKKNESESDFIKRLKEEYFMGDRYQEGYVEFTDEIISNYAREKQEHDAYITSLIESGYRVERWPRNSDVCVGMYGQCDYLELCAGCKNTEKFRHNDKDPQDMGLGRSRFLGK